MATFALASQCEVHTNFTQTSQELHMIAPNDSAVPFAFSPFYRGIPEHYVVLIIALRPRLVNSMDSIRSQIALARRVNECGGRGYALTICGKTRSRLQWSHFTQSGECGGVFGEESVDRMNFRLKGSNREKGEKKRGEKSLLLVNLWAKLLNEWSYPRAVTAIDRERGERRWREDCQSVLKALQRVFN